MANNRIYLYHPRTKLAVAVVKCMGAEWYAKSDVANRINKVCDEAYDDNLPIEDTSWEIRYEHHTDQTKVLPGDAVFEGRPA